MRTLVLLGLLTLSSTALAKKGPGSLYVGAHGGAFFADEIGPDLGARVGYGFKLGPGFSIGPELGVRVLSSDALPWVGAKLHVSLGPIGFTPFIRAELLEGDTILEFGSFLGIPIPFLSLYVSGTQVDEEITPAAGLVFTLNIPGI